MNLMKFLVATSWRKENFRRNASTSLFILLILSACVPDATVEVLPPATHVPETPTLESTPSLTSPAEGEPGAPYYLSLATQPDIEPQTLGAVSARIDWAYVDESRVALHYTISGLKGSEGTVWDATLMQITSPAVPEIGSAGGQWSRGTVDRGVFAGDVDWFLPYDALDADEHPEIDLHVEIPLESPTPVGTFQFDFRVPVQKGIRLEHLDQTIVVNNIAATLKMFVLTPSHADAALCFEMPSEMGWGLETSTLTIGDKVYPFAGGRTLPGTKGASSLPEAKLCQTVGFDIQHDPSAVSVTLTIPRLMVSLPGIVTQEEVVAANQRLAEIGIEFGYITTDRGGKIEIIRKPDSMAIEETYPLISEALAEQYEGPWIFTIPLER